MNTSINSNPVLQLTTEIQALPEAYQGWFTRGMDALVQQTAPVFTYGVSMRPVIETAQTTREELIDNDISTFAPEPYALKCPIKIKIVGKDSEYIASHHESNIHASGDTPYEAIENLKSLILDTFDCLISEPEANLGIKAKHQLALLQSIIERE